MQHSYVVSIIDTVENVKPRILQKIPDGFHSYEQFFTMMVTWTNMAGSDTTSCPQHTSQAAHNTIIL